MGDVLSGKNRALLYRQIGDMARSGLPIERVFTLAASTRTGKLAAALEETARRLAKGSSLGDALGAAHRKYPGLFAGWEIRYVAFGEKAGHLPDFLLQIADQAEEAHALTLEIISGFAYPLFLMYITILAGPVAMLILQGPLPYMANVAGPLIIVTALLALGAYGLLHPMWRGVILATLRHVPVLGKLVGFAGMYRWATSLALAYRGGLPLDEAWPMAAEASTDSHMIEIGRVVTAQILAGGEVSPVMQRYRSAFPLPVLTAYQTGEATGRLDSELLHAAKFLRREIEVLRKAPTKLVNGVFFVLVAAMMVRNVLDMYKGPMELINNAWKNTL